MKIAIRIAIFVVAVLASPVFGLQRDPPNLNFLTPKKVIESNAVFVGKVTGFEKETVELKERHGDRGPFTVAIIEIETAISGVKNITHVKVAFSLRHELGSFDPVQFVEGRKAIYFLTKDPGDGAYYRATFGFVPIEATDIEFKDHFIVVKALALAFRSKKSPFNPLRFNLKL